MGLDLVKAGRDVPNEINVVIEIPKDAEPVKYEVDTSRITRRPAALSPGLHKFPAAGIRAISPCCNLARSPRRSKR